MVNELEHMSFGQCLRCERSRRKLTQEELAQALETSKLSIVRWEKDNVLPHPSMQRTIYAFFEKTPETFGSIHRQIWHVPFERNPYFRGRDAELEWLHKALVADGSIAITQHALSGLGGIGKTQIAVEYAYRYAHLYTAVLWVRADSHQLLASDFISLTSSLNLKEKMATNPSQAIGAVKHWLQTQSSWLLIFDNVEDIDSLTEFLPTRRSGSVLITTRIDLGKRHIRKLNVKKLHHEESLSFLFLRAKLIEQESQLKNVAAAEYSAAQQLCVLLDGLPLALEQAAAYIEKNQCSVVEYLSLFQQYRSFLLAWQSEDKEYPYSVSTTWSLSFQKIEKENPVAADLLRVCAFLHPDAIPEEFFWEGAAFLGPRLQTLTAFDFNAAMSPLFSFSLVKRDKETKSLLIHRLVQLVQQEQMGEDAARKWIARIVCAINALFPNSEFAHWPRCERYLPHALAVATLIEQKGIAVPESVDLLNRVGSYLKERSRYLEAVSILKIALVTSEQLFGPQHLRTADVLCNLAATYRELTRYDEARPLYERTLAIRKQYLGMYHQDTAKTLMELGDFHMEQSVYSLAATYYKQAQNIYEQTLGAEHPETLSNLNLLAGLYHREGRLEDAEKLWCRVLAARMRILGTAHPDTARVLQNLAILYVDKKRYDEAKSALWQAFDTLERTLGMYHRATATVLRNLAEVYTIQGQYEKAEMLWQRALVIRRHTLGEHHADTQLILEQLREFYQTQGLQAEVESRIMFALQLPLPKFPLGVPQECIKDAQPSYSNHTRPLEDIDDNEDVRTHKYAAHAGASLYESYRYSARLAGARLVKGYEHYRLSPSCQ